MTSQRTKNLRVAAWSFTLFSIILTLGPVAVYSLIAFQNSQATTANKCILLSLISVATILSIICVINKYTPRCRMWLVLIGLYLCLDYFLGTVLVIAISQILDELVISPLARYFRHTLKINKEIDKRG